MAFCQSGSNVVPWFLCFGVNLNIFHKYRIIYMLSVKNTKILRSLTDGFCQSGSDVVTSWYKEFRGKFKCMLGKGSRKNAPPVTSWFQTSRRRVKGLRLDLCWKCHVVISPRIAFY